MNYVRVTPLTATEVRNAVAALVPAMSTTHSFDSYEMYYAAAGKLSVNVTGYYQDQNTALIANAFYGQVKRALDLLASQGTLVKIGKDQVHPGGRSPGNVYYRPEALEATLERTRLAKAESDLIETRWALVHDQLTRDGIMITSKRGGPVELSLDMFERIVDQLAAGQ
jgi:hypothetical protein